MLTSFIFLYWGWEEDSHKARIALSETKHSSVL